MASKPAALLVPTRSDPVSSIYSSFSFLRWLQVHKKESGLADQRACAARKTKNYQLSLGKCVNDPYTLQCLKAKHAEDGPLSRQQNQIPEDSQLPMHQSCMLGFRDNS